MFLVAGRLWVMALILVADFVICFLVCCSFWLFTSLFVVGLVLFV